LSPVPHLDAVQKVEAAYLAGLSSAGHVTTAFGVSTPLSHVRPTKIRVGIGQAHTYSASSTAISDLLAPPAKPYRHGASTTSIVLAVLSFIAVSPLLFALGAGLKERAGNEDLGQWVQLLTVAFAGFSAWGIWESARRYRREQARLDADYGRRLTGYEKPCSVWCQLYYCSRDNLVFNPLTGNFAHVAELGRLVHEEVETYCLS
jgi:hypothetical protein